MITPWTVSWMFAPTASAQSYDASPCQEHPELRETLLTGKAMIDEEGPRRRYAHATSMLAAPVGSRAEHPDLAAWVKAEEELSAGSGARLAEDVRGCRYGAMNLLDGHASTAWCEGVTGTGVGEVVVVELPGDGPLRVRNGFGKSDEVFTKNARIRRVDVVLLGAGTSIAAPSSPAVDLPVLAQHTVELADQSDWQPLPLPTLPTALDKPKPTPRFVALRVLSVWPGTTWEDTCLSEVALGQTTR